jgi:hypothetical protein
MFDIIKDKPMPEGSVTSGRPRVYPFDKMAVGDCFKIGDSYDAAERVRCAAKSYAKNRGSRVKFGVRKDSHEWFIWRMQ